MRSQVSCIAAKWHGHMTNDLTHDLSQQPPFLQQTQNVPKQDFPLTFYHSFHTQNFSVFCHFAKVWAHT